MKRLIIPVLLLLSVNAFPQRMLSLEEAIATALQNNYDILLSRNDSAVAALDYAYRDAAFYPRLNASMGTAWNRNNQKQTLADGTKREQPNIKSSNINAALNLNWTLFDGLKMFVLRDKAEALVSLGELNSRNQVMNTVATVINTYYDIVRQKQQLKAVEEQMSLSNERVKLAQNKLDIGVGTKPDVLQSRVDYNAQKALQLEQRTLIEQLKEQLNQVMNVTDLAFYEVADSIPINMNLSLGEIQNNIYSTSPVLRVLRQDIDIAKLTIRERKADRWPTVSFNSVYNFTRTENQTVINPFSPLFNQSRGLNFGFTASIPILNNLTVKRQVRQAELDLTYRQLVFDNQRSQLNLAVILAFKEYEQQKRALELEEENIRLARENVDIVFQVYKLNSTTLIQLKEAEKSLQDAYTRLITARYNTKLAETELMRLKGELVR